ncbi:MAG: carboxypeptidase-like regulatory domain-containing protein, partial [Flavisolibacter sp.]
MKIRVPVLLITILIASVSFAQKKSAIVDGKVVDENENPLSHVSVILLGQLKGIVTSDSGKFQMKVPAERAFALVFTYTGYKTVQQNFLLSEGEHESITIRMEPTTGVMKEVVITEQRERTEVGLVKPNPKSLINMPSPVMGVESMLKVIVGSNNELTSQYNVRGGSYDENLIYVND